MGATPQETIRQAAEAYLAGDQQSLYDQLHENARVIGSEQRDMWSDREEATRELARELDRRRATSGSVRGGLIDQIHECEGIREMGDVAMWSTSGDIELDGYYHRRASWTVVVTRAGSKDEEDWRIVHSHFSIHR